MHIATSVFLFLDPTPSPQLFVLCFTIFNASTAAIDTLANGISAVITKMNQKIETLQAVDKEENEEEKEEASSGKAFGNFSATRTFFRSIMGFIGGIVSTLIPIRISAVIIGFYTIFMLAYAHLIFKEEKVRKNSNKKIEKNFVRRNLSFLERTEGYNQGYVPA